MRAGLPAWDRKFPPPARWSRFAVWGTPSCRAAQTSAGSATIRGVKRHRHTARPSSRTASGDTRRGASLATVTIFSRSGGRLYKLAVGAVLVFSTGVGRD
jgi:hypothetical protein